MRYRDRYTGVVQARHFAVMLPTLLVLVLVAGCGGGDDSSESSAVVREKIERARKQGAAQARRQERVRELQRRVRRLEKKGDDEAVVAQAGTVSQGDVEVDAGSSSEARTVFHTPSGNVACEVSADRALCSVESSGETFEFSGGSPASIVPGLQLAGESGSLAPYGTSVVVGSIGCTIPNSNEPAGVICTDGVSGHGFEASRVPDRRSTW